LEGKHPEPTPERAEVSKENTQNERLQDVDAGSFPESSIDTSKEHIPETPIGEQPTFPEYTPKSTCNTNIPRKGWVIREGSTGADSGRAITVDKSGNVYFCARFAPPASFGKFTNADSKYNVVIAKRNSKGTIEWAEFVGVGKGRCTQILLGNQGEVFAVFNTDSLTTSLAKYTLSFGPGIYVAKLTAGKVGGTFSTAGKGSISLTKSHRDGQGNYYFSGHFSGSPIFFNPPVQAKSQNDCFLLKRDSLGKVAWIKHFGGSTEEYCYDFDFDKQGNILLVGNFHKDVMLDKEYKSPNVYATFIVKLSPRGQILSTKILPAVAKSGQLSYVRANSITVAPDGSYFVQGQYAYKLTLGNTTLSTSAKSELFIAKFTSSGSPVWLIGSTSPAGNYHTRSVALKWNCNGYLYSIAHFNSSIQFAKIPIKKQGFQDILVSKIAPTGQVIWTESVGGVSADGAGMLTMDGSGNNYVIGNFSGKASYFVDESARPSVNSNGSSDIVIWKFFR